MILRSIELESFGKFRGQSFEFRRGLNLVIGPNEAGKSTLVEAIPAVLFGSSRLERFKPWGRNSCVAELVFEGQGRTVHLKRNLLTDDVQFVERDDLYHVLSQFKGKAPLKGRTSACREYRELLDRLLGLDDESLFRATCFFGHYPQEWTGDDLSRKLRTLVSGSAEADYAEILDDLLDEHFQLTRCSPWGRDKKNDREYENVCDQLAEVDRSDIAAPTVEVDDSSVLQQQIDVLTEELSLDRREYEKGVRYIDRVRQQATAEAAEHVEALVEEPVEIPVTLDGDAEICDLRTKLAAACLPHSLPRELPELLAEAAGIRQSMAQLQQPLSLLNQREKNIAKVPWMLPVGITVLAVLLIAAAWLQQYWPVPLTVVSLLCVAAGWGWGFWRHLRRQKAMDVCRKERTALEQKKAVAQKRQSDLSERCEALGLPSSAIDLVRLQKAFKEHRALIELWWNKDSAQQQETKAEPVAEPEPEEPVQDVVATPATTNTAELTQMQEQLVEFAEQLREKEQTLANMQQQLQDAALAAESSVDVSVVALQRRKFQLERRISILRQAVDLLATAVDEYGKSHLSRLNNEVSRMFSKLTDGRYTAVRLDDNMMPSIQIDGRSWRPIDRFSRGTVDALYLSLRIALAKVRNDGRVLPLMLDDPFVHLDQKRLSKAMNLIDLAASEGQLILLSHNQDLGKRAARERWHVVSLAGDSAETLPEEGGDHVGQLHLL